MKRIIKISALATLCIMLVAMQPGKRGPELSVQEEPAQKRSPTSQELLQAIRNKNREAVQIILAQGVSQSDLESAVQDLTDILIQPQDLGPNLFATILQQPPALDPTLVNIFRIITARIALSARETFLTELLTKRVVYTHNEQLINLFLSQGASFTILMETLDTIMSQKNLPMFEKNLYQYLKESLLRGPQATLKYRILESPNPEVQKKLKESLIKGD